MQFSYLLLVLVAVLSSASAARILAVLPFAGKSHHIFFQAFLKPLALRGHQVVVYSPIPLIKQVPNYIDVHVNTSFTDDYLSYDRLMEMLSTSPIGGFKNVWFIMNMFSEQAFQNKNMKKLIKSNEQFDLVITETFFGQEAFVAFGHKFNAPTISLQPYGTFSLINKVLGNSLALSYFPEAEFPFSDKMSFYDRIVNSYSALSTIFSYYYSHIPTHQSMVDRHMKMSNAPSLEEMIHNISMVFTNAHPTIHYPRPFTPNIVQLGGIHVSTERKPLPKNIQKFMDEATNGVIYFSFGSFVPEHLMPNEFHANFVKVFKKLSQRVLWKTRLESIPGLPDNVITSKWMPQKEILAHPNCVLFMTHGGLLSLLEAVDAGVPVVGTPFFGDQPMNVNYYVQKGLGVKLEFLEISEETITNAVKTVISNPEYKINAKRLSRVSRDLPMSLGDTAVFWVEYVLRHQGAKHLRPFSTHLSWYQLALLDVVAAILAATATVLLALYLTCRKVTSLFRGSSKKNDLKKKKN